MGRRLLRFGVSRLGLFPEQAQDALISPQVAGGCAAIEVSAQRTNPALAGIDVAESRR